MAQQANITVFDGATPPVAHVLIATDNKVLPDATRYSLWREQIATLPTSAQVSLEIFKTTLRSGVVRTRTRITVPVMESIAGQNASGYTAAPKVAYEDVKEEVTYSHPRSTMASRQLCAGILHNFANNISTTVTPVAAGPNYEAHVADQMPT